MIADPRITCRQAPAIVVGSGVAGLACALAMAPAPVVLVTKTPRLAGGSSLLSQGGIAAALGPGDSPGRHALDTLRAGAGLVERDRAGLLAADGLRAVRDLIAAGFPADRDANHELALGREGAHSEARIVHAGGDATGRSLVAVLLRQVAQTPSIEVLTDTRAVELLVERGRIAGLLAYRDGHGWLVLAAPAVVLATGGAGALWRETTNPAEATGDGLALAARAGARLADLEFMQFHPTALVPKGTAGTDRLPLLTEALRGAGARLLDEAGRAFMRDEHPLGDLAPRDTVARAIWRRRQAGAGVVLDLRPALARSGEAAFPQAVALCREAGYQPGSEPVPVTPAAHYHMGGVLSDEWGRTSLPGLWACGEAASTGVHGANRLASNSLLEALVWARRVAAALDWDGTAARPIAAEASVPPVAFFSPGKNALARARHRLRGIMSRHVGIVRDATGLSEAAEQLERLAAEAEGPGRSVRQEIRDVGAWSDLRNMLLAARLITLAALRRRESRGAHFRSDHPRPSGAWAHRQTLSLADLAPPPEEAAAQRRSA